ncbi:MAG: hypothetical protein O2794_03650 [bacterium]|nr:hypothetical protein [bacterium]
MKKIFIYILIPAIFLLLVIVGMGWFPAARVDGETILYRDVKAIVDVAEHFRETAQTQNPILEGLVRDIKGDERQAVLEELIIQNVVNKNLSLEARASAEVRIDEALNDQDRANTERAVRTLYGLNFKDFRKYFLRPQVEEILLREEVEGGGGEYPIWLEETLSASNIKIYFLPYEWSSSRLERK